MFLPGMLFIATTASAETIELVTYYPSNATTGNLHVTSLTVGTAYNGVTPPDGVAAIYDKLWIGQGYTNPDRDPAALRVVGFPGAADKVLFLPGAGGTLNVGIGTTNPTHKLQVDGSNVDNIFAANVTSGFGGLGLSVGGTDKLVIGYAGNAANYGAQTAAGDISIKATNTNLHFVTGPGNANTAMYIRADGNVGIGTAAPTERLDVSGNAHVSGDVQVDGALNGAKGVFIDNLFLGIARPWGNSWTTDSTSFVDIPGSDRTITLPAGIAVITYSLSGFAYTPVSNYMAGMWKVRVVIGSQTSPEQNFGSNEQYSHKGMSGSWVTNVTGGSTTIKLQIKADGRFGRGFELNSEDYITWTIVVYRS